MAVSGVALAVGAFIVGNETNATGALVSLAALWLSPGMLLLLWGIRTPLGVRESIVPAASTSITFGVLWAAWIGTSSDNPTWVPFAAIFASLLVVGVPSGLLCLVISAFSPIGHHRRRVGRTAGANLPPRE